LYNLLVPGAMGTKKLSRTNRVIILCILASVLLVVLESEQPLAAAYPMLFTAMEIVFGFLFVVEYLIRLWVCVEDPRFARGITGRLRYAVSPLALFDLLAILPFLLTALGSESFIFRLFRLVRILRLSKLGRYSRAAAAIGQAVHSRRFELTLSLAAGLVLMLIASSGLYLAEGKVQPNDFGSIPRAMWWSVSALTTVGYGDVYPITVLGKILAAMASIIGVGLIAMPAGILAAAFSEVLANRRNGQRREDDQRDGSE
jgi:voltage-gated potassium channel|tara:strand:+ start:1620 stop:2393 length:774 start_codon:yes stop_codon:yes gene_type:complete